ncbi:adhesion G protein-coupled receptor E3, partial [Biomphalaria glabrata]
MSYPFYARTVLIADASYDPRILYQMLINFEDLHEFSVDDYVNECNETTWPAPNGECLQLRCSLGKTFKNGTCTSIFPEIKGLVYRLRALLKVTHRNNETTNEILDLVKRQ